MRQLVSVIAVGKCSIAQKYSPVFVFVNLWTIRSASLSPYWNHDRQKITTYVIAQLNLRAIIFGSQRNDVVFGVRGQASLRYN